ncbi:peptidoglycan DD-metalloendopeptidase family protein [Nitrospinota bacterium]
MKSNTTTTTLYVIVALAFSFALAGCNPPSKSRVTPAMMLSRMDTDGDGKISRSEFTGRKRPFTSFDANADGAITRQELRTALGADLDPVTRGAFLVGKGDLRAQEKRGVLETGLESDFPKNVDCPTIDHVFGEDWRGPEAGFKHYGADIPVLPGTPMLAIADGTVVAKYTGEVGYRGFEIIVRHAPEDTGLPLWIYTQYSHFAHMPSLKIGQRVRMGEKLGPTGRSGIPGTNREDHLHLGVYFSKSEKYVAFQHQLIPVAGHYMDPLALMRGKMPVDSHSMAALPKPEKQVRIPYKLTTGAIVPPGTKIIWPYACNPK